MIGFTKAIQVRANTTTKTTTKSLTRTNKTMDWIQSATLATT